MIAVNLLFDNLEMHAAVQVASIGKCYLPKSIGCFPLLSPCQISLYENDKQQEPSNTIICSSAYTSENSVLVDTSVQKQNQTMPSNFHVKIKIEPLNLVKMATRIVLRATQEAQVVPDNFALLLHNVYVCKQFFIKCEEAIWLIEDVQPAAPYHVIHGTQTKFEYVMMQANPLVPSKLTSTVTSQLFTPVQQELYNLFHAFVQSPSNFSSLLLHGPSGTGKVRIFHILIARLLL